MRLTPTQRQLLRRVVAAGLSGIRLYGDGNAERTARSLIRRGLVEWTPPGTHAALRATDAGSDHGSEEPNA